MPVHTADGRWFACPAFAMPAAPCPIGLPQHVRAASSLPPHCCCGRATGPFLHGLSALRRRARLGAQSPWTGGRGAVAQQRRTRLQWRRSGKVEASVTALTPRAGYAVSERISVWGALGYGAGELTLTPKDQPARKTDIAMTLPAIGARGTLVDGDGPKLGAAVADALGAGDHGECHRVRRKWRQPGVPGSPRHASVPGSQGLVGATPASEHRSPGMRPRLRSAASRFRYARASAARPPAARMRCSRARSSPRPG